VKCDRFLDPVRITFSWSGAGEVFDILGFSPTSRHPLVGSPARPANHAPYPCRLFIESRFHYLHIPSQQRLRVAIEHYTATTILHFYNLVVLTSFLLGFAVTAATSKRRQFRPVSTSFSEHPNNRYELD
jgi:hypothetical protein